MKENAGFSAFEAKVGTKTAISVLEKISDVCCSQEQNSDGVKIHSTFQHNACNHTYSGTIEHDGKTFAFIIESGDWNGTVIRAWGSPEDVGLYAPPKPVLKTFVPKDPILKMTRPGLWKVYFEWTKQEWFREKVRSYNYDRHFQPGGLIEKHYTDWADKKGLRIATEGDDQ